MRCQATANLQHKCSPNFHFVLSHLFLPITLVTSCFQYLHQLQGQSILPWQKQVTSVCCCCFLMFCVLPFQPWLLHTTYEHQETQRVLEKRSLSPGARIFQCILIHKSFLLAISSEKLACSLFQQHVSTGLMNISWKPPCEKAKFYLSREQHWWGMDEWRYLQRDLWI